MLKSSEGSSEQDREARAEQPVELRAELDDIVGLPLFEGVQKNVVERLATQFRALQYRAGALVFNAGDTPSKLSILTRGIVELCRVDDDGDEHAVLLLAERDLLAPAASLLREPSLLCARALTTIRILEVEAQHIRSALASSPELSFNLLRVTSGQWRMAVRSILDLTARSAPQRLGAFLLRFIDLQGGGSSSVLPIPKRYLAARLGMTPETLSRALQTIAKNGLHLRGRTIIVRDREQIENFCGPDPYPATHERNHSVFAI
jgi:CRP/FNR family transcriptional activator FtrB